MSEFLLEIIRPANLPATVLLGVVLLYWLMMITGILGLDLFDIDFDADAELDADVDGDIHGGGVVADVLTFFHLGEVPVMIFASFFVLFFWACTIVGNHYLNPQWSLLVTLYFLVPSALLSLVLTKLAVMPMTPLFRSMMKTDESTIIGSRGVVSTSQLDESFGQISIEQEIGPPIVVNARTENAQKLDRNQLVEVIRLEPESDVYVVAPAKPEKSQ